MSNGGRAVGREGDKTVVVEGVHFTYPGASQEAVAGVGFSVEPGEFVAIVGPNGCGKTTLLRLMVGSLRPTRGAITVLGRAVDAWRRRELATAVAVVTQREEPAFPVRVEQTVFLGRYPHIGPLGAVRAADREAVRYAVERCDIGDLTSRWVSTLSGGEWQRVRVARALAQQPRALVLDEPTANLDIRHEMDVFELASELARDEGLAVVMVTHHVNLAARFADRILVLANGQTRALGAPRVVLTADVLEDVFEWPVHVLSWRGAPQFVPLKRAERENPGNGNRESGRNKDDRGRSETI